MQKIKFLLVSLFLLSGTSITLAQNKVVVVPMAGDSEAVEDEAADDSDLFVIVLPGGNGVSSGAVYLDEAIPKPIVWNKGWDTNIGNRPKIDNTVPLNYHGLVPWFGRPANQGAFSFDPVNILHWGEQTFFNSSKDIYAKGVLLIDRGANVQGGPFEWLLNRQDHLSLGNIVRTDNNGPGGVAWIREWIDPRPGERVYFFIMSDDERFCSNVITFIWP